MFKLSALFASFVLVGSVGCVAPSDGGGDIEVVLVSEVEWGALNPARGEAGPRAGTLWGDRAGAGASGFLVEFREGFESPPHIHNVSYRGVVVEGLVHNDVPGAEAMWMPAGSYWTQPRGGVHITSASGAPNVAYIEIEDGPYLVQPVEEAFDSGEAPVNVDAGNLVWLDLADGVRIAHLWGSPRAGEWSGALVELADGFAGALRGEALRVVVIGGRLELAAGGVALEVGSSVGSSGQAIELAADGASRVYVRVEGELEVVRAR